MKISFNLHSILFLLTCILLTRQVPFMNYSIWMNVALLSLYALSIPFPNLNLGKEYKQTLLIFICYIILNSSISLLIGNPISNNFRFTTILLITAFAPIIKPRREYVLIFLTLITIQSIVLITGEIFLLTTDYYSSTLRNLFLSNNWGDVYPSGLWYKIQIRGSALIPIGVLFANFIKRKRTSLIIAVLNLIGCFIAGNFAFILGLSFFLMMKIIPEKFQRRSLIYPRKWKFFLLTIIILFSGILFKSFKEVVNNKSIESNPLRIEQLRILSEDLGANFIWGNGLGNLVPIKTINRNYSDNIYYEIQTMYVINQIGVIGIILYLYVMKAVFTGFISRESKLIFLTYFLYSLFNPYVFDTNQSVFLITLMAYDKFKLS